MDPRDTFIEKVVSGNSFVEIGGLWGTVNEKVSVAHTFGADEITMIDMEPDGTELWDKFHERMKNKNITNYQCISTDIQDFEDVTYDVVHSAGILYHLVNPMEYISKLSDLTKKYLIISSAVTQDSIENKYGRLTLPQASILFVPALKNSEKKIIAEYWKSKYPDLPFVGISEDFDYEAHPLEDPTPWWWLPTVSCFKRMCTICGLKLVDEGAFWNNDAYTLMLKK